MSFDPRAAKLLQAGEHITFADHPGLRLEARAKCRTWIYRYKSPSDGKMKQAKLGQWPAMSYHKAVTEWEQVKTQNRAGRELAAERQQAREAQRAAAEAERLRKKREGYLVRHVIEDYCEHLARVRKAKGAAEARRTLVKGAEPIAELPAGDLTRAEAFDLLELYVDTPVQCGKLRAELAGAWDYALDAGRLPEDTPNWWRQIMRGRLKSKGKRIAGVTIGTAKRTLSQDELRVLIAFLPNFSRNVSDVLALYLWTGARGAEIVQMEAHEIAQEDGVLWWTCPKAKTKNARFDQATDFRVPLFGKARQVVERRLAVEKSGYLFKPVKKREGHVEQKVVQTSVYYHMPYSMTNPEVERPRLPVTRWSPHDLRRTVRTQLAALGCPKDAGEVMLGHMLPGVEGVYNQHDYDAEKVVWLTKWSQVLESLS
ncbi:tyrosine-type recombinase/integrase [Massilia sp. CT11-137]|uniref:tyrosine-type recombinase/integrase n=1 Tax=Massilia sp. CT11-137 TaxID=3393901 RepID=UPI0039A5A0AC